MMFDLKRKFLVMVMGALMLASGATVFGQKGGDKRPPKDENKVVAKPKDERPPRNNSNNQGNKQPDGKKRP